MTDLPDVDTPDEWTPVPPKFPVHWLKVSFDDVFDVVPTTGKKIAQKQYLKSGMWPVIDQGASFVGGYTDDKTKIINVSEPLLVFGDHTRCMKFVRSDFAPGADGTKILAVDSQLDPKFYYHLYFAIKLPDRGYSRHFGFLKRCVFPLPPINEQRRIVEKIEAMFDEIDKGVESLQTARTTLGLYRQSLLKSAFEGRLTADWRAQNADKLEAPETLLARIQTERDNRYKAKLNVWQEALKTWRADGEKGKKPAKPKRPSDVVPLEKHELKHLPAIPDAWAFSRLALYIDWIEAGKSFKCLETEPHADQVGVAKVSALTWGEYDETESKTCLDGDKINEEWFIRTGDFLLSRANTIELVGASVIAKTVTKRIMLSDKTLRIHFAPEDRRFFLHHLRSPYGRAEIEARSTGNQESMRNIGQDRIKNIIIPLCSEAEQAEIVRILDEKLEAADALEAEIDATLAYADALRQSILKKAFSGQLIPQDHSDEPAAALLERIKAERLASPKIKKKRKASA